MARVLLIEDHEGICDLLCEVIRNQGHAADVANTVADAKAALKANDYDLAVIDVRLPDGSGREVAGTAAGRGTKVLLMSGHPDEIILLEDAGVAHLPKPFRIGDFIAALDVVSSKKVVQPLEGQPIADG